VNHVSQLHYVKVGVDTKVDGNTVPVTCLEDSGTGQSQVQESS